MKSETMIAALHRLIPGADYGRKKNPPAYKDLVWRDERPMPTLDELKAEGAIFEAEDKIKKDQKTLVDTEGPLLYDALLDLLPPEFDERVAAYRAAKQD